VYVPSFRRLLTLVPLLLAAAAAHAADPFVVVAGDTLWLTDPVVVVGSRVPVALPGLLRSVSIADADEIALSPVRSAAEQLQLIPEVEIRQRQQYGVQADLSIRGSTFDQVRVQLDGMDVGDPQTGHHNLDLPLGLADIARLEVLRGQGSSLYGSAAFGGVLNVVSRTPGEDFGGMLEVGGGGNATRAARVRLDAGERELLGAPAAAWLSVDRFETDGDRAGTQTENVSLASRLDTGLLGGESTILAGYSERDFGALDFYAPYPSRERTRTTFAGLRHRTGLGRRVSLEQRLHGRRHEDRFVLFGDDPDRFTNEHATRRLGSDTRLAIDAGHGLTVVTALDAAYEDIESVGVRGGAVGPALGSHARRHLAGAVEFVWARDGLRGSLGSRVDAWNVSAPDWSRSAALAWSGRTVDLRGSVGTVFRLPTFTELYYIDPANVADPHLDPEHGWAWDLGGAVRGGPWTYDLTFFERHEEDLIDWARPTAADEPWRTRNIAAGRVSGWTQAVSLRTPRGDVFALHHTQLDAERSLPAGFVGKYTSLTPRRQAALSATARLHAWATLTAVVRHRARPSRPGDTVADLRLVIRRAPLRLVLDATNVFDRSYEEIPGVPMPGRLLTATTGIQF
jgi:iron complex outermembrane receptor protein